jgi:hypothetical protein
MTLPSAEATFVPAGAPGAQAWARRGWGGVIRIVAGFA